NQAIHDRTPVAIPRSTLGVLRFSTGEQVSIEGPIVIGRTPAVAEVDGERAVQIAIDNSELSRTHATVHVVDWFVYVADNGSTNGTRVIAPGMTPETCRLQDRIQITPGTVVDLGGVVTFRFDVS
ncbi:MAG: FHA domain-containing protein, partial [Ilumatobacteraceae bacterium]